MQGADALERNANAAGSAPPPPPAQALNFRRAAVVQEFVSHYDIRKEQIFFDGDSDEPYFDFEALSLLVNQLTDIPSISVSHGETNMASGFASASCQITLADGRSRAYSGSAFIGEGMPGGGTVENFTQALALAQARALRTTLRAVSFNPLRAHEAKKAGADLEFTLTDPRQRELREAHALGAELGLIVDDDKTEWRKQIGEFTRGEFDSMETMDERTRGHFLIFLRALKRNKIGRASLAGAGGAS